MATDACDRGEAGRLAAGRDGFLAPHHLAAAERLERLILRAQLMPRVTMSYNAARVGGRGGGNGVEEASDSAAAARQQLNMLARFDRAQHRHRLCLCKSQFGKCD